MTGANVTVCSAIVGGTLTAQASNQLSLVAGNVDVVGTASLTSQNGLTNASNVLSGENLFISAPSLVNTATGSLASTATTTIDATNFNNAGIVNGTTTNVSVSGGLTNVGGALMGLDALTINTGSLNNQNGLIFAGNPNVDSGPTTGNLSLTINGGNGSLNNVGGQLLAQDNLGLSAVNNHDVAPEHGCDASSLGEASQCQQNPVLRNGKEPRREPARRSGQQTRKQRLQSTSKG